MLKKILKDILVSAAVCAGFLVCARTINLNISLSEILYHGWIPLSIIYVFCTITDEKLRKKEMTQLAKEGADLLTWGTVIIANVATWKYHNLLKTEPGEALDVIPIAMAAWLGLIFITLIYAQVKKEEKKED